MRFKDIKSVIEEHIGLCDFRKISCDLCHKIISFNKKDYHYNYECDETIVKCPLCQKNMKRRIYTRNHKSINNENVSCLKQQISNLNNKLNEVNEINNKKCNELQNLNNEYINEINELKNETLKLKNEIKKLKIQINDEREDQKSKVIEMINVIFEDKSAMIEKKNLIVSSKIKFSELIEKYLQKINNEKCQKNDNRYDYRYIFNGHEIEPNDNREIINIGLSNCSIISVSYRTYIDSDN